MARRASRVNTEEEEVELNMTPMLDVVFILLIFFIVTSVFIKEPGVQVERPDAATTERQRPSILIAITGEDEVWINRRIYDINGVRGAVEQLVEENPRAEAMIQGDQDASIGLVLEVQQIVGNMGIRVNISTRND
ncbi:MAG: biopolymer transporter ExbD [Maricaulis sp.]|nr:biopolymer transporter ExbD [Maricaulis sp.]HAQ34551.1 biopolymer transporter ExbD [Alphaproteobacteria bacterium]|tara:strand:- start:16 stop:420 length:405 start_codon:yes stop_codon:yes gene_type:complete